MSCTKFYVADEYGWVLNSVCGCSNCFSTYEEALEVCKKVAVENCGNFRVEEVNV